MGQPGTDDNSASEPPERGRRDGAAHRLVLESLREEILRGDLAPGQRLVEAELAAQIGVARASVRSALIELTNEGLVERVQHRGARVRVVTLAEAIEITECRMALEGVCAAKTAERVSDREILELKALTRSMREVVSAGDLLAYSDLNQKLHQRVREISAQRTAAQTIERLRGQFVRHQFRLALQPGRPSTSLVEHEQIVAAIANRDPTAAEQATRAHLSSVIEALKTANPSRATVPARG